MAIDVDAYIESLEPPSITIGGKTYVGQFLSLEEWLPFEARFQMFASKGGTIDLKTLKKLIRDYCYLAFPEKWYKLFNPWHKTMGDRVNALPPAAILKVMRDFFESQARVLDVRRAPEEGEIEE